MVKKQNSGALDPKIGSLFIIGFDGTEVSSQLGSLLTRLQPAGVILFSRNIASANQTHKLLQDCQTCVATPLFTCVDMEGGRVDRFRALNGGVPSAADVFATLDPKLFRRHGKIIGAYCRALGFNTDFAPVVDLAFEASKSVMSSRAVSADPRETAAYAGEFLSGLRDSGVLGCGKHFPGLGAGSLDSHRELPVIPKSLKQLWVEDLLPYRLLGRQMPFVLVSHAGYPAVTRENIPASLSKKWIASILRKRLGYRGFVVSDDMEMGAILGTTSIEAAAIAHIQSGGDICLICHREELIFRAYDAVVKEAESNRHFRRQVINATKRVARLKNKLLTSIRWRFPPVPTNEKLDRLSRQLGDLKKTVSLKKIAREEGKP